MSINLLKRSPFKLRHQMTTKCQTPFVSTSDAVIDSGNKDAEKPEALVFFLPSIGDTANNYGYFFDRFSERLGFTTFAMEKPLGPTMAREKEQLNQHLEFMDYVENEYYKGMNLPKYLIGHSFGALKVLRLSQMHPDMFNAIVLVNPLLEFKHNLSALKKAALFTKARFRGDVS